METTKFEGYVEWADELKEECILAYWYLEYLIELGERPKLYNGFGSDVRLIACQPQLIAVQDSLQMIVCRLLDKGNNYRSAIKLACKLKEEKAIFSEQQGRAFRDLVSRFDTVETSALHSGVRHYRNGRVAHLLLPEDNHLRKTAAPPQLVLREDLVELAECVLALVAELICELTKLDAGQERLRANVKTVAYFNVLEKRLA
ncbi:hypothetical protein J7399_16810 [Shimia sp. R9_1]|uniref:AbiU2 domain-containing protein n=1 Tax=Shimia sp. R9_1 TaxID=2821111 RepID=UPI001ADA1A49|nr:hypothetical protein [Shimia sp. R9_1]MBO9409099.1 hypothetical protein [Shimia sp. R9_1]